MNDGEGLLSLGQGAICVPEEWMFLRFLTYLFLTDFAIA